MTVSGAEPSRLPDARLALGPAMLDDLFPTGPAFRRSLQTYFVLLALAALIASFGLYEDSVAAIIGAMVVAPLGGAIMALAGALVTGRTRWQAITSVQIGLGSLMVVALAFLVSTAIPNPLYLTPSLAARTHPGLLDLGVALAAGAAGAWVAARRTASSKVSRRGPGCCAVPARATSTSAAVSAAICFSMSVLSRRLLEPARAGRCRCGSPRSAAGRSWTAPGARRSRASAG